MSIVSSALGLATGGMSSFAGPLVATGLLASVGLLWFHEHNLRIADAAVATVAAQQATLVAQEQHNQDQRTIAGLTDAAAKASARAVTTTKLKEAINATSTSTACAASPAVRTLLDGLRGSAVGGNAGPALAAAGGSVALPGPAHGPGR